MSCEFVHLHLHTEYSMLDGAVRLDYIIGSNEDGKIHSYPLAEALKQDGQTAVAITDHGNLYGVYNFVNTLKNKGIKPIIGSEFYVAPDMYDKRPEVLRQRDHLILLAKSSVGYSNLMYLSSKSFIDGFYGKPRIDLELLKGHTDGLICLSACLAGRIPRLLLQNDYESAREYALKLKSMFEDGDFYIELQDHSLKEEKAILPQLVAIAKEIGVKVVATNDVHYIKKEDADLQDTMMRITQGLKKSEVNPIAFETQEFYLKSQAEMKELFDWIPEAIESTVEIADKCQFDFVLKRNSIIPKYTNEEMGNRDEAQYLRDLAYEGVLKRYPSLTDELKTRLDYELGVIVQCGYAGYFLIVWDFVNQAKKMGIPVGPGRGSGVGSLVAYCIGITDVDPIKYSLIFERFLSTQRVSMPDFDIDFCFFRRGEIIDYVTQKYGKDNVAQIVAYSTMSAKAVIKDVARVYDIPFQEANKWVSTLPKLGKPFIGESLGLWGKNPVPEFIALYQTNEEAKKVIDVALKLEGMPRQTSVHAAGVVICPDPIVQHVPLQRNDDIITTQFDKDQIEKVGLLKMDFLVLKTLTDISDTIKLIKKDKGVDIDFHKLGYDDKEVFKLIASGDCEAVFQLESAGMKNFMAQLKPNGLEEIIAGISLYRPGPKDFIPQFIKNKKNSENIPYEHEVLKNVLKVTYGVIVYQEQVMQIAKDLAGFSLGGADILRRAISKKKEDILKANEKLFIDGGVLKLDKDREEQVTGCVKNGLSRQSAKNLWNVIVGFASYAFNKSHAAAYAVVCYQTAYLKRYYPLHFIISVINNRISSADEVKHYINYLKDKGYKIYPPDINRSSELFTIEGDGIRYGLKGIKNMGEAAMKSILDERQRGGAYKDIRDLVDRNSEINKRMLESLIKGGALDCFGQTRATLIASYEQIVDSCAAARKGAGSGQISLFDELIEDIPVKYTVLPEFDNIQKLNYEKEVLGMYASGHPLDEYRGFTKNFNFSTADVAATDEESDAEEVDVDVENTSSLSALNNKRVEFGGIISSFESRVSKSGNRFAIGKIDDFEGQIGFAMFGRSYEKNKGMLQTETPVIVKGKLDLTVESEPKVVIDEISPWVIEKKSEAKKSDDAEKGTDIVYIKLDDKGLINILRNLLRRYPGDTKVIVQAVMNGKSYLYELSERIKIGDDVLSGVKNIVGGANVKIKSKK